MNRIVVAHRRQSIGELAFPLRIEIGPRREHAMVVGRRRPYLTQAARGHQALALHRLPRRDAGPGGVADAEGGAPYAFPYPNDPKKLIGFDG